MINKHKGAYCEKGSLKDQKRGYIFNSKFPI